MSIVRKPGSASAMLNSAEVTALRQIAAAVFNGMDLIKLSNDMIVRLVTFKFEHAISEAWPLSKGDGGVSPTEIVIVSYQTCLSQF